MACILLINPSDQIDVQNKIKEKSIKLYNEIMYSDTNYIYVIHIR